MDAGRADAGSNDRWEVGVGLLADTHLVWALFGSGALLPATTPRWWVRRPTHHVGPEGPGERSA